MVEITCEAENLMPDGDNALPEEIINGTDSPASFKLIDVQTPEPSIRNRIPCLSSFDESPEANKQQCQQGQRFLLEFETNSGANGLKPEAGSTSETIQREGKSMYKEERKVKRDGHTVWFRKGGGSKEKSPFMMSLGDEITNISSFLSIMPSRILLISKYEISSAFEVTAIDSTPEDRILTLTFRPRLGNFIGCRILASDCVSWLLLALGNTCSYVNVRSERYILLPDLPNNHELMVGDFRCGDLPHTTVLMWMMGGNGITMLIRVGNNNWIEFTFENIIVGFEGQGLKALHMCEDEDRVIVMGPNWDIFAVTFDGVIAWGPLLRLPFRNDGAWLCKDFMGQHYHIGYRSEEGGNDICYIQIDRLNGGVIDEGTDLPGVLPGREILSVGQSGYIFSCEREDLFVLSARRGLPDGKEISASLIDGGDVYNMTYKVCNNPHHGVCTCSHGWIRS